MNALHLYSSVVPSRRGRPWAHRPGNIAHNRANATLNEKYHFIACQSMNSVHEDGNWSFQVEKSRGGQPSSLHKKINPNTIKGQEIETKRAPGGPRNSNSFVLGLSSAWEGSFLVAIMGTKGVWWREDVSRRVQGRLGSVWNSLGCRNGRSMWRRRISPTVTPQHPHLEGVGSDLRNGESH